MANVTCPECESDNVTIDDGITCEACGVHTAADAAAEHVLSEAGVSRYESVKDSGEDPLQECPNCGAETFANLAGTGHDSVCTSCGETVSDADLAYCGNCGKPMTSNEMSICSECLQGKIGPD